MFSVSVQNMFLVHLLCATGISKKDGKHALMDNNQGVLLQILTIFDKQYSVDELFQKLNSP